MDSNSIVKCSAQAFGIILPVSSAISLLYGDSAVTASIRAASMVTAQFVTCIGTAYANEADPESSHRNSAVAGSTKYTLINFGMGKPFSPTAAFLGAYNSAAYSYEEDISNYFGENVGSILHKGSPVIIEGFEAVLSPIVKTLISNDGIHHKINPSDVAKSALIGIVVVIALETTYPASKATFTSFLDTVDYLVELLLPFGAETSSSTYLWHYA